MADWKDRLWDGGPVRYPDPAIEIVDARFQKYAIGNAAVERLCSGLRWGEGPVWFGDLRCLIFSDIPNNRMMRWCEDDGRMSIFRYPSHNSNGNTRDLQGRLVTCEHDTRRVTRTEYDGSVTVLMDRFEGRPLNAPNDVVVTSDGRIWFTDPGYGIMLNYEGHVADYELPTYVYRLDAETGQATVVADDFTRPNGLCFSPDESRLYISDTGASHGLGGPAHIRVFDVENGTLKNGRVFADMKPGFADGIRCDTDGNVWASSGWGDAEDDGVKIFAPDGDLIGKIHLPEPCSNLCFGGQKKNRIFMTGGMCLYALYVEATGA